MFQFFVIQINFYHISPIFWYILIQKIISLKAVRIRKRAKFQRLSEEPLLQKKVNLKNFH